MSKFTFVAFLYLSADRVHRLARGEGIPLRYMKSNPQRYLEEREELPSGIGWLRNPTVARPNSAFSPMRSGRERCQYDIQEKNHG